MCAPSAIGVGSAVFAKDKKGFWYRVKVIAQRGEKPRVFHMKFSHFRLPGDAYTAVYSVYSESVIQRYSAIHRIRFDVSHHPSGVRLP